MGSFACAMSSISPTLMVVSSAHIATTGRVMSCLTWIRLMCMSLIVYLSMHDSGSMARAKGQMFLLTKVFSLVVVWLVPPTNNMKWCAPTSTFTGLCYICSTSTHQALGIKSRNRSFETAKKSLSKCLCIQLQQCLLQQVEVCCSQLQQQWTNCHHELLHSTWNHKRLHLHIFPRVVLLLALLGG